MELHALASHIVKFAHTLIDDCKTAAFSGQPTTKPPQVLYHFTDAQGLIGVATQKAVWASLATTLNDCMEVRHGVHVAEELLHERLRVRFSDYEKLLLEYLEDPSKVIPDFQADFAAFVSSFCRHCDKSSQWLHYGRSGRGVAIGFSPAIAEAVHCELVKVDYSRESQRERMGQLLNIGASALRGGPGGWDGAGELDPPRVAAHIVSVFIPVVAAMMKHPSFEEEEEWRLIDLMPLNKDDRRLAAGTDREVLFRQSGNGLVPYRELHFGERACELIKHIVVGYSATLAPDAIRLLLLEAGLNRDVMRSDVPVR